ncbi:unnamed protein product [Urochloa humidicola]
MPDAFSPPSPPPAPAPSPLGEEDLADAGLPPWPSSPWPAPEDGGGGRVNPLFTILPVSALAIGLVLLVAVAVILVVTRRARPREADAAGDSCNGDGKPGAPASASASSCGSHNTRCGYAAAAGAAGCIYVGRLGFSATPAAARSRGAQVFTYRELERATDGFSEANVVGRGASGEVFRGRLDDGTPAAIKRLRLDHRRQGEREFRIEVDLLSRMDSPYLVGLLGYCADQSHRLLVFEFMPNGSLRSHLHPDPAAPRQPQQQPLGWQTRLGIALDCARALEFLHEHSTPAVIHRDFNCSNVLLDHNFRARVSDFGMAKVGSNRADGQVVTRVLGTTGYLAPEYASTGKLTTKSDVYSYGVVLLELLTGRVPVDTQRPPGQHVLVSWALPRLTNRQKLVQMVDPALKGQFALKDLIQVAAIAAMCVQTKAEYRPLMTDVVQSLIPIAKPTPAMSCSSTPLRSAMEHVIFMSSCSSQCGNKAS